jgi:hypothetical protein
MPTIPLPCTNCFSFHYGVCRKVPKQCFHCGGLNHIQRYCPWRRRVRIDRRAPLPGTRIWCEMFGLNEDRKLKRKVLDALKKSPDSPIWINGECIYSGNEHHFNQTIRTERGRPLEYGVLRGRSRSPVKRRAQKRSQSPARRCGIHKQQESPLSRSPHPNDRFRSRTPIRRQSDSYSEAYVSQLPRSCIRDSNSPMVVPRSSKDNHFNCLSDLSTQLSPAQLKKAPMSSQTPLGEISANLSRPSNDIPHKPSILQDTIINAKGHQSSFSVNNEQIVPVEDPYFGLGVSEGATEVE